MAEAFFGGAFDLGPVVGNNSIAYSDSLVANLFFQLWAFLVQMILLNIFVAILMDGYAEAQEEGASNAARMGLESPESILADINTWVRVRLIHDNIVHAPKSWKYDHVTLMVALQRLQVCSNTVSLRT